MFESIRKALSLGIPPEETHRPASAEEVARWAGAQQAVLEPDEVPGGFALSGQKDGVPWRMECGTPTRGYIQGLELRGGADARAWPDAAVMVLGRALQEHLESWAYARGPHPLSADTEGQLPEEVRWLASLDEVAWDGLPPSFLRHFAVLSGQIDVAQRWLQPALVSRLLNGLPVTSGAQEAGALPAEQPLVLMLARGSVYLRMPHDAQSLQSLAHAVDILTTAARCASKGVSKSA